MAVDAKETAKRGPQSQPQLSDTTQAQNYIALFLLTKIDGTHCTCVCELQKFKEFVRAGPAQNLRTGSNETRLFITILSSSTHDDLCNGIENIIVHISAHTPGDIFIWSLNNSAKYHVASQCANVNTFENGGVYFESLGNVVRQTTTAFSGYSACFTVSAQQFGCSLAFCAGEHWETPANADDPKKWHGLKWNDVRRTPHNSPT